MKRKVMNTVWELVHKKPIQEADTRKVSCTFLKHEQINQIELIILIFFSLEKEVQ